MAHITLALKTPTGDTLATHALDTTGAPQHIAAMNGAYYQFTDAASGLAPEGLITKRQGDDLYITFDDGTDLIIDHYFSQGQGALVGQQANGGLRNYPVAALGEHELAAEIAAAPAVSAPDTAGKVGLAVLGGLALVGGGIAIAARDHDKHHHDDNVAPQPQPEPQPSSNPQANHAGKIAISGEMKVGQTLAAQVSDGDGAPDNVQYQWLRDGEPISGETGATYRLSSDDAGHKISVHAEYTDAKGTAEKPTSTALDVENITQTPVANHEGTVSITGGDKVGSTLTANISDADGVPDTGVTYQWLRDGQAIDQANGKTYILTPDDADHQISVQAAYKDKAGHDEDQTSDIRDIPASPSSGPYSEYAVKAAASTVVNVKNPAFGAKGDGKTDDTAAIQKAIDAVAAKGGGIVDIPNGTYLINTLHQESSYFETSGLVMKSNVTLRMTSTTLLKAMPNDSQYAAIITIKDANNVHLIGGTIEGDRASHTGEYGEWGHGVSITNSTNVTVKNVTAKECWGDGFYVGKRGGSNINNENITFDQVHAEHNRRQGMSITHGKHIKVQHSVFKDTDGTDPRAGIDIEPNKNEQVSDVVVTHNTFIGNRTGFVAMNHLHGGTTSVKNITFEYNKVQDNHVGVSYIGVEGGKIRHNTIYQKHDMPKDYPFHHQYGIELRNGVRPVSGITVDDNSIYGGNIIDRYTKGNTITNNHFKSAVYLHGTAQPGKILTAEVYDGDYGTLRVHKSVQVPSKSVSYRWYADGAEIKGAHESTYKLTEAERGKKITVKVTFTDIAGHNESATSDATMPVGYKNHAPTNITLSPRIIYGNEDHAEVGLLKAIDPDYKDRFTYTVSDSRFEINGDMLRLKKGQRIDYSKVNSFNLTVTATDQMGASYKKTFTVYVRAPRGTPTFDYYDLTLSANKLMENKAGATVGRINLRDRSIGKTHTYSVSDKRFEIVNGVLKLKAGYKIDYALEKTIAIAITASNSGGLTFRKTFTLQVQDDPNYPAKVHRAKYVSPEPVLMHSEDKEDGIQKGKTQENDERVHNSGQYQGQHEGHGIDSAESDSDQLTADAAGQHISANTADTNIAEARETVDSAHNQVDTNDTPLTLGDEEAPVHISSNLKEAAQAELADKSSADILEYLGEHGGDAFTFDAGETLHTLTAAVADEDGVPKDVQYQWLRDGQPISGGTGERYQLTADDAGHKISVQAFYQDKAQHNESPVSAQSEVPKDATPPTGNFHDDFSAYPAGSEYAQGTTFGQWNVVQSGYGHVKIVDNGRGNNALELKPKAQSGQTATSSTEVIGPQHGDEFTFSGTISTPEQLRQNAPPNAWETGWLVWNYTDNDHFYYFVPRANGWELGKRDPAYKGGQRFIASGNESWPLADAKEFSISKHGNTVEIKINGKVVTTITDDSDAYSGNGRVGIYSEDARVHADNISLSKQANIEGKANHAGSVSIQADNTGTLHATINDGDNVDNSKPVSYQWYAGNDAIAGATGADYTPTGQATGITVRATYTDGNGHVESIVSPLASASNGGSNHPGSVTIEGEAREGNMLTAHVSDADGVDANAIQYTWLRDGNPINFVKGNTYTLTGEDVGHQISVQAYYHDKAGHEENNVISAKTAAVTEADTAAPAGNLHLPRTLRTATAITACTSATASILPPGAG